MKLWNERIESIHYEDKHVLLLSLRPAHHCHPPYMHIKRQFYSLYALCAHFSIHIFPLFRFDFVVVARNSKTINPSKWQQHEKLLAIPKIPGIEIDSRRAMAKQFHILYFFFSSFFFFVFSKWKPNTHDLYLFVYCRISAFLSRLMRSNLYFFSSSFPSSFGVSCVHCTFGVGVLPLSIPCSQTVVNAFERNKKKKLFLHLFDDKIIFILCASEAMIISSEQITLFR